MKLLVLALILACPCNAMAAWIQYFSGSNGDVFFYDDARLQETGEQIDVWTRIQYKSSLMGASSYQSRLRLDCAAASESVLQSTFFSDGDWTTPAMATNTKQKPATPIATGSATEQLVSVLCSD